VCKFGGDEQQYRLDRSAIGSIGRRREETIWRLCVSFCFEVKFLCYLMMFSMMMSE
jgi:hypothetical protein